MERLSSSRSKGQAVNQLIDFVLATTDERERDDLVVPNHHQRALKNGQLASLAAEVFTHQLLGAKRKCVWIRDGFQTSLLSQIADRAKIIHCCFDLRIH